MKKNMNVLKILLEVSRSVSSSLELEKVSVVILKHARSFTSADYSALFLLDDVSRKLMLIGAEGFREDQLENLKVLGSWERINRELVKKKNTLAVSDIRKSCRFRNAKVPFSEEALPLGAFLAVPLKKREAVIGALIVSNHKKRKICFSEEDRKLLLTLANYVAAALLNAKLYGDLKKLYVKTISSLTAAIDARDRYTRGHSERVAQYSVTIAEEMNQSEDFTENLRLAGILHDVGKIGIRDNILSKRGILNEGELRKVHEHPMIGYRIVRSVVDNKDVLRGMEEHHERFDGSGYPKKLKNRHISLQGKIIAVADTFDTITTDRPYKRALSVKEALLEIVVNSGTLFDPRVVKAFQRSFCKHPHIWHVK